MLLHECCKDSCKLQYEYKLLEDQFRTHPVFDEAVDGVGGSEGGDGGAVNAHGSWVLPRQHAHLQQNRGGEGE